MRNIRNILSVVCGYVAAVIGAGFASGQEIISFFVKYGKYSIIGVLLSCIIFSVFAYAVLSVCVEKNIETYEKRLKFEIKLEKTHSTNYLMEQFDARKRSDEKEFMDKLSETAKNAIADACTGSNPRIPTQEEMEKLLVAVYYDKDIDF